MLIKLENINKSFSVKKGLLESKQSMVKAVDDVSLHINEGESLGLVGESGSGKTTLARILMRLIPFQSGKICFKGEDVTFVKGRNLKEYRKNVQMVFQDPFSSLDPRFTIRKVMTEAFSLVLDQYQRQGEKEKRILDLLTAVDLEGSALSRYPHEFSGGERQRIAIARSLVVDPKLLILDEAVSSLDVIIQEQILKLLTDLQRRFELSYLVITHNLRVVERISHRVAVMYKGRIVEIGSTRDVFENPKHSYTKILLDAALNYQSVGQIERIIIDRQSQLVDTGNNHWVLL